MSTAALNLNAVSRPAVNPWLVATAVVIPTFMEILDTTIATASLRYIAGGLSATMNDSDWVMTSYLAANATILPITGWISAHLGRRNYFLLSIAVFTVASVLCGMATSLEQLILFRVIQGVAGGGLQPASQGILIDSFPPEKQGTAMTLFGVAGLIAPVIGPTLGGYITVNYNWRWIFLINLPIGAIGFLMCHLLVEDPDYLKKERAELRRRPLNFDYIGLGLLALMMACWEILLSKGQEWDWYNDPFWQAQTLAVLFVVCLGALVFRELRIANPVVDFRPLGERNLAASSVIIFCAYGVLYGASVCLPSLLQSLFGYDAFVSGLVMSPSGVFSILMMLVVGVLLGRGTDARWLIAAGLLVMAAGNYWMARMNLYISPGQVIWPRVVLIVRPVDDLRPDQRGGLPLHPPAPARGRGRPVRPAPQRGGQRGHVDQQDHRATARAVPPGPRGREPQPAEPTRAGLFQARQGLLHAADGRSGPVAGDDPPVARRPPPAAGGVPGLLRRLLAVRRPEPGARAPRAPDEALRGRAGGARRGGVGRCSSRPDHCLARPQSDDASGSDGLPTAGQGRRRVPAGVGVRDIDRRRGHDDDRARGHRQSVVEALPTPLAGRQAGDRRRGEDVLSPRWTSAIGPRRRTAVSPKILFMLVHDGRTGDRGRAGQLAASPFRCRPSEHCVERSRRRGVASGCRR